MIQIPAFLVFAVIIAALLLVGGLINAVYGLGKRMAALEAKESDLRSHLMRLERILYDMNPGAFRSTE